jgi:DNA-directed RNA polymerase beta' subunit
MRLTFVDIESMFDPSRVITSHDGIVKDRLNPNGIYSEVIFGKLDQESYGHSCACGKTNGRFYEGENCQHCGRKVQSTEPSIERMGWINLGDFPVVNPNFYKLLLRLAPRKLPRMVGYDVRLTRGGSVEAPDESAGPYDNMGLIRFVEEFPAVVEYLRGESKLPAAQRDEIVALILENTDKVFMTKVPVFSSALRPAIMVGGDAFVTDEINNTFNMLVATSNQIRDAAEEERTEMFVLPLLASIQDLVVQLFDGVVAKIKGKGGFVRNSVMSNRLNFSSRCVITPLPASHGIDDIVLPYLAFMELYRFHLINLTSVTRKISIGEADAAWHRALAGKLVEEVTPEGEVVVRHRPDPAMLALMAELVSKTAGGLSVLFNRNPTINFGSILLLRVAGVKQDYDDLTASINNLILKPLGADFDGDTLNIIPIMDARMKKAFSVFSPKRMFVDRNDGKFNDSLGLDKDMILGLLSALTPPRRQNASTT